jgi:acetyl esterase/lipase
MPVTRAHYHQDVSDADAKAAPARRPSIDSLARRLLAAMLALAVAAAAQPATAQGPFYQATASELVGPPGTLIRQEMTNADRNGATTYRVLYRSIGLDGQPIAVSGTIIVPLGPAPPGGRPIVAWAHPTSGVVPKCAPSLALFKFQQIMGLRDMVRRGYIVTATDYPGLGTVGPHPYLVGVSEGRAVLDSVRAAENLTGQTGADVALWGHSQGGQAVLYAGLLAASYAPDLHLTGIAAAAPATELGPLMRDVEGTPGGKNLLAMTLWSWARVFNAPIDQVVDAAALPEVDRLANICLESPVDIRPRKQVGEALEQHFLSVPNLTALEPWRTLLAQNTIGALPPAIPIFIAQGDADVVVEPAVTRDYVGKLCAAGSHVTFMVLPGVGHGAAAMKSALTATAWMSDRFAGAPPPDDCAPQSGAKVR